MGDAGALVADDPNNPEYRMLLANSHNALGRDLIELSRWPESEANHRQALAIYQRLTEEYPQLLAYRVSFAQTLHLLANVFDKAGKADEAEQTLRQVREIREKLALEHPEVPDFQNSIAGTLNNLATALMNRGEWEEARKLLEQAVVHERAALETNPGNKYYRQFLTTQLNNLTAAQLFLGDTNAASQTADDSARYLLQARNPERLVPTVVVEVESLINHMERIRLSPGGPRQEPLLAGKLLCVKALIRQTVELAADDPKQYQLADLLSTASEELRDPDLGLKLAQKAHELNPEDGMCAQSLGWALFRTGDWRGSIEAIKRQTDTSESGFILAMAYWQLGEKTEAVAQFERSNAWLQEYEQLCEEKLRQRVVPHPSVTLLKRLQTEAAALLGMTLPTADPVPDPTAEVEEAKELPKSTPAPEAPKAEDQSK